MENILTAREEVALRMLQSQAYLINGGEDEQCEKIINALDFADYFLDLARDESLKEDQE